MPRYSRANVIDIRLLDNPPGLHTKPPALTLKKSATHLPRDIKLTWDNDLVFDEKTGDYNILTGLEAVAQRLFLRMSTQLGENQADPEFGWDYSYVIDVSDVEAKVLLPVLLNDFEIGLRKDPYVNEVRNLKATLERIDDQTSVIRITADVLLKNKKEGFNLTVELR